MDLNINPNIVPNFVRDFPRRIVLNKRVGLEPFPAERKNGVKNGVIAPMDTSALVGLKVLMRNESGSMAEGYVAYVRRQRQHTSTWGKEVLTEGSMSFILVPEEEVLFVDRIPESP